MMSQVILCVCSPGGHLMQMEAIVKTSKLHADKVLVSPDESLCDSFSRQYRVSDSNKKDIFLLIENFFQFKKIFEKEKPDIVISTGAAPGVLAFVWAKFYRVKTIWIESIANKNEPSLSGKIVRRFSDRWITQSKHVSHNIGGMYFGEIFNLY